jgi:hypothetical protein
MGKGSRARPFNVSKAEFDNSFESIFGKRVPTYLKKVIEDDNMQVRANPEGKIGSCGCGRSPTGNCIGWHGLTEDQYTAAKDKWDLEQYQKQAQETWTDSCTTPRTSK